MLYGSQARGDALPDSDVDVLVVLKGSVNPYEEIERTGEIVAGLSLEHNLVISCAYIPETRLIQNTSPFLRNVQREGIVIMSESPAALLTKAHESHHAAEEKFLTLARQHFGSQPDVQ